MSKKDRQTLWGIFGTIIIVSIITGALAGVIASVFTSQSLDRYFEYLSKGDRLVSISEVKPRPLPGTYEEALSRVQEVGWPSTAAIRSKVENSEVASEWIVVEDVEGFGAVITNDGWILFHQMTMESFSDPEESAEIWIRNKRYQINQVIEDELTDFVLVKVDARDLPAFAFGASAEMKGGEMIFQLKGPYAVQALSIGNTEFVFGELINRAEVFEARWELTEKTSASGPLVNSNGELVGFSDAGLSVLPLHQGISFVQSVLRTGGPEHAAIGAYVVDVDSIINIEQGAIGDVTSGAYLVAPKNRKSAIVKDGPADIAGLQDGDIILSVDDTIIFGPTSLAEAITSYRIGGQATLTISRDGGVQEIQITFANYSDLVY